MIPMWKLKREGTRLRELIAAWLGNLYEPALKRRHDRWRIVQPVPKDRGIALTPKVAIFLIYQPNGVARSILGTLRWLVANGYAPFVIANTPLSEADRAEVAALSWRIFERPNFGYDFGGYRDGVLLLKEWGIAPERLLIINDSVWMPTRAGSTLIARLEAVQADVAGGIKHKDTTRRLGDLRRGHLESYLYLVNPKAGRSEAFHAFWQGYPVSSQSLNAVHRGERRFAYLMQDAGLTVSGLFSKQIFLDALASQHDTFLRRTLAYASFVEDELVVENARLLQKDPSDPDWRNDVMRHITRAVDRRRFNACFAYPADKLLGMDFIKKSAGSSGGDGASLHSRLRRQLLCAVQAGDLPPLLTEVQAEIEALERRVA